MSTILSQAEPGFFGKDDFVPFIGQVEDVNDPKRSNRVRVRCLGFHVETKKGEGGVKTENLPWAKVAMPVTHSQQMGVGGKHGLQPSSWVWGFFLDGKYCQKPMVCGSFNFTAKASDKDNRDKTPSENGTMSEDVEPYQKNNNLNGTTFPNKTLVAKNDEDDIAHDTTKDDSGDGECPISRSVATEDRESERVRGETKPEGQIYDVSNADGICGAVIGARDEIQSIMKDMFPPNATRFTYGDMVWDLVSGNSMDINGILSKISIQVAGLMRQAIQVQKAFQEKIMNRLQMSTMEFAAADRDGVMIQIVDKVIDIQHDTWHTVFSQLLEQLQKEVMTSLQGMNNQEKSNEGQNNKGSKGAKSKTKISDTESICITDTLLNNISIVLEETLVVADTMRDNSLSDNMKTIEETMKFIEDLDRDDYDCEEDVVSAVNSRLNDTIEKSTPSSSSSQSSPVSSGFNLSDATQYLQMVLDFKYTLKPDVFNAMGPMSLDSITKQGCKPSRLYNTAQNAIGNTGGMTGGEGGGSESGKSSKDSKDVYKNIGFGGKPVNESQPYTNIVCEDALTSKISDGEREEILSRLLFWAPVDFHSPGTIYSLNGEVVIDGQTTNNDRILVTDQIDSSENGIYITSVGDWRRSEDANEGIDFTKNKIVTVKNKPVVDEYWVYTGDDKPRPDSTPITFTRLFFGKTAFEDQDGVISIGDDTRPNLKEGVGDPGRDITNRLIVSAGIPEEIGLALDPFIQSKPSGFNGLAVALSLPTGDPQGAINFVDGVPNVVCIINPGKQYYFTRGPQEGCGFPSIFIPEYLGAPVPVVDPKTGEFVAIMTKPVLFGNKPSPSVSLIPDHSCLGIRSDDENYDIVVGGIYVANTGFDYSSDVVVELYDKDRETFNGITQPVVVENRIVEVQLINNGIGFKRIPKVIIKDPNGYGAKLYPIMYVRQRVPNDQEVKPIPDAETISYCPAKYQQNLYKP